MKKRIIAILLFAFLSDILTTLGLQAAQEDRYPLWDANIPMPQSAEIPLLENVTFKTLFCPKQEKSDYRWLHGVTIVHHGDRWLVTWGHNKGSENTITEVVRGRWSDDDFQTLSPVEMIAPGTTKEAASHGITCSRDGTLWGFFPRFRANYTDIHTEAMTFNEKTGGWESNGFVWGEQFWPMADPLRMDNGNWIVAGFQINGTYRKGHHPPAVAISHGDDWTRWEIVTIKQPYKETLWCESGILVSGSRVMCIARGLDPWAYVSTSDDYGRSWTPLKRSNLPMAPSKPYTGTLSTGHRYLICTTTADTKKRRCPLTIAIAEPDSERFSKVFRIRDAVRAGEDPKRKANLSYPYAVERDGKLYVVYSCRRPRHMAELAIIPLESLGVKK